MKGSKNSEYSINLGFCEQLKQLHSTLFLLLLNSYKKIKYHLIRIINVIND